MRLMIAGYPETRETLLNILTEITSRANGQFFRDRMSQVLRVEESVVFGIMKRLRDEVER